MADDCVFCKIIAGEIPAEKVLENDKFIVIKDANPKVDGHSLVIPKEHFDSFTDLPSGFYNDFLEITREAVSKLLKENESDGFNLVNNNGRVAGQIVPHLHLHILPRRNGDGYMVGV